MAIKKDGYFIQEPTSITQSSMDQGLGTPESPMGAKAAGANPDQAKMVFGRIYCIVNILTGKLYVGQTTKSIDYRFNQHVKRARCKSSQNRTSALVSAIRKYGAENFAVEELEEVSSKEELDLQEIYWIEALNTISPEGYNLMRGGESTKQHPETISKIRKKLLNRKYQSTTIDKMRLAAKQRHITYLDSYIKSHNKLRELGEPIVLFNDIESLYFRSVGHAKRFGFNRSGIYQTINGKQKTTKGYKAAYLSDFMEVK